MRLVTKQRQRSSFHRPTWLFPVLGVTTLLWIANIQVSRYAHLSDTAHQEAELLGKFKEAANSKESSTYPNGGSVQVAKGAESVVVSPPRFACVFIIGGCDAERPAYRHYVYNILVATKNMRDKGSKVDVVVLVQMDAGSSADRLPEEDTKWFESLGIKTKYLPKSGDASFYRLMQDKFRILAMTEYDRCLYLDADVMPLSSLDYLFQASMDGLIRPNVVLAGISEPANGGFFMLAPNRTHVDEMHDILKRREDNANAGLPFDPVKGWGHEIVAPDKWESNKEAGENWIFWAAFADQGLLYYWTKYHRRDVTILFANRVENWGPGPNETVVLQETLTDPFAKLATPPVELGRRTCKKWTRGKPCLPPYADFVHFSGRGKPWYHDPPEKASLEDENSYWWYSLEHLNKELNMGLNFQNWTTEAESVRPLHGTHPVLHHAHRSANNLHEFD